MADADTTTTAAAPSFDDDALERSFFAEEEEDVLIPTDAVLERKRSPAVTARRAKLSWAVKAIVVGALTMCAVEAVTRLHPGDDQAAAQYGASGPAR